MLTTNVDRQFFRVFPEEQICAFQGDFGYCQCSQPCRDAIWENHELVKELTGRLVGVRLPEDAVPRCPDCGRVLVPWVRDDTFLEGGAWKAQVDRYHAFLRRWLLEQSGKNVLLLELGVGEMTPSIIKLPFWELTARNENVFYACVNRGNIPRAGAPAGTQPVSARRFGGNSTRHPTGAISYKYKIGRSERT